MKVLITGGAGFIGTRLSRALLVKGHGVTVLDNFSHQVHGEDASLAADLQSEVHLLRGDVRDRDVWVRTVPGHQVIVHLAAETGTGQSMYEVTQYEQVNIFGTALLYDLLAKNRGMGVERIVVASSRAIYGEGAYSCAEHGVVYPQSRSSVAKKAGLFDPVCPICRGECRSIATEEGAPFQPSSFYGLTKQVQEQATLMFGRVLDIPSIALRYQNVYGPGQSLNNPYTGILAIFSNLARVGFDINVFEDGLESRDFVYIDDVVRATTASVELGSNGSHSLNVGSGKRTTVLQIAEAINQFFGNRSKIAVNGAFREGDIRHGLADLSKAFEILGYGAQVAFNEGLTHFLAWAAKFNAQGQGYERSLDEMKGRGLLHERA